MDTRRLTHTVPKVPLLDLGAEPPDRPGRAQAQRAPRAWSPSASAPRAAATRVARAGIRAAGSPWKLYEDAAWRKHLGVGKRKRHALNRLQARPTSPSSTCSWTRCRPASPGLHAPRGHEPRRLGSSQTVQVLDAVGEIDTLTTSIAKMYATDQYRYWNDPVIDPKTNKQDVPCTTSRRQRDPSTATKPALAWPSTVNPTARRLLRRGGGRRRGRQGRQRARGLDVLRDAVGRAAAADAEPRPRRRPPARRAQRRAQPRGLELGRAGQGRRLRPEHAGARRSRSTTTGSGCCRCTSSTSPTRTTCSPSTTTTQDPNAPERLAQHGRTPST